MHTQKLNKKGQVFTIDYIIGVLMFIVLILLSVKVLIGMQPNVAYEELSRNTIHLSDQLLSEGYPEFWNETQVIMPGLTNGQRLNATKLNYIDNIAYAQLKTLYHVNTEFVYFFMNKTGIVNITNCVHGYPIAVNSTCDPQLDSIDYNNLVKIERLIVYNSTVLRMRIYGWN